MVLQGWIMRRSLRGLAGIGVAGTTSIIGGALVLRQVHLRSSPVVEAAEQQLRAADAVRELLGSAVVSTSGVVGGYTDPVGGTACITLPIVSEGGVRGVARVEAEAEWVIAQAHAEARGETPPEATKAETCRWLLRHLEVELEAPNSASNASSSALTLYSLPKNTPLSAWAPSRAPSVLPRWLRSLLPEPTAVAQADNTPRLIAVGVMAISAHILVFVMLHRRMITEQMLRRAETMLTLPETPTHDALAGRAFEIATSAMGPEAAKRLMRSAGAPLYGHSDDKRVLAFTSLKSQQEFFFKAERFVPPTTAQSQRARAQQPNKEEWTLTHVAVAPTINYSQRLAQLPTDANEMALLETMLSVETKPLDVGMGNRHVVVPLRGSK